MNKQQLISTYELLPAVYKLRDERQGGALEALLRVIDEQVHMVQSSTRSMMNDWFIETCKPEMVPYIGELVGGSVSENLLPVQRTSAARERALRFSFPRREVANAIALQKRKGTLPVLEQIALSVAGWHSRAIEWYPRVAQFQNLRRIREFESKGETAQVHGLVQMGQSVNHRKLLAEHGLEGPFSQGAFFSDSKKPTQDFFPKNKKLLRLHVWRLKPMRISQSRTRCIWNCDCKGLKILTLDCAGIPRAICNDPSLLKEKPERGPSTSAIGDEEIASEHREMLPLPLTICELRDPRSAVPKEVYYGRGKSLTLWHEQCDFNKREIRVVPRSQVVVADLSWVLDCKDKHESCHTGPVANACHCTCISNLLDGEKKIAVDPEHGLIAVRNAGTNEEILATYHYLVSGDLGGGEYERNRAEEIATQDQEDALRIRLRRDCPSKRNCILDLAINANQRSSMIALSSKTEEAAHNDCNQPKTWQLNHPNVILELADGDLYQLPQGTICIPSGYRFVLRASKHCFPTIELNDGECGAALTFQLGKGAKLEFEGLRFTNGCIDIQQLNECSTTSKELVSKKACSPCESKVRDAITRIRIDHCTLIPTHSAEHCRCVSMRAVTLQNRVEDSILSIRNSIVGKIRGEAVNSRLLIEDSIIDGQAIECNCSSLEAIHMAGTTLKIERCTVFGTTYVQAIEYGADSIFTSTIDVCRKQIGGMRFCYIPEAHCPENPSWNTPQQYFCQPSQAYDRRLHAETASRGSVDWNSIRPMFTSAKYGESGYGQLLIMPRLSTAHVGNSCECKTTQVDSSGVCPDETCHKMISQGAESGSEMGVFHDLYQPQRMDNLKRRIEEFTPFPMTTELRLEN